MYLGPGGFGSLGSNKVNLTMCNTNAETEKSKCAYCIDQTSTTSTIKHLRLGFGYFGV